MLPDAWQIDEFQIHHLDLFFFANSNTSRTFMPFLL